jgi:4-amino-4-deoxy-L-arabinose transferase-like glycosyltransferase
MSTPADARRHLPRRPFRPLEHKALLAAALVFVLLWFAGLDHRHIIKADEGRYAEIAREMVASGDWLTPRLNGFKYFEKPALQYWMTAAAYELFGVNEWTARLWTALTGFLGVILVGWAGTRAFGRTAGLLAAAALGGSVLYVFVGHFLSLDMGVSFFMTLAVLGFMLAQADDADARSRRTWMLAGWAAMALAVLSKGLIGVVLPVGAVAAYVLVQRDWRLPGRLHLLAGGLLFLAIAAPWFVAVSLANPEFFHFFFIHEHFERFLTTVHGRYEPAWYFIPVLALGLMPWLPTVPPALWRGWSDDTARRFRPARFLVVWCAVVFLFFSASDSKLPSYVLPIVPAVALLLGRYLPVAPRSLLLAQAGLAAVGGAAALLVGTNLPRFASATLSTDLLAAYAPWIAGAGVVMLAASITGAWLAARRSALASTSSLAVGALIFMQLVLAGHESLSPAYSAYDTARRIRPYLEADRKAEMRGADAASYAQPQDIPVYFVNTFDHSLPFYLGRTGTMVAYMDELAVPIGWEPSRFLPDLAAFAHAWARDRHAYAIIPPADYEALRKQGHIAMQVISADARRVLVRKP